MRNPLFQARAEFQNVDGSEQVVLDQLAAAGFSVDAGQHAGIGGGIENPIATSDGFEVARAANIGVEIV